MKRFFLYGLVAALMLLNGCTSYDKKIRELEELIKKLEARVEALEKLVLPPKPPVQTEAYNVPLDDSPIFGNKDAKVHIIAFSNFQCPYCARADKALRALLQDDELKDKINIVFKNFPFERMPQATPAAKAALAAGEQGKFWEMSEKIFAHQGDLGKPDFKEDEYQKWAKEIGLDITKFKKDLAEKGKTEDPKGESVYDKMINRDKKEITEDAPGPVKLEGTPWILVGGWMLEGDISPASIKKMIADKKL